jgi:uncharacterized iron-regulated protein
MKQSIKKLLCHFNLFPLFGWSLSFLLYSLPAYAQETCSLNLIIPTNIAWTERTCKDRLLTPEQVLPELAKANVVYLAETHDRLSDHQIQLEIIQQLHARQPKLAIAMEMFQRPYQEVINQYLAGKLTEEELVKQTEYEQRWGFPWDYYSPILRYARAKKIPVIAANTPSEITRKVARQGLASLTEQERQFIPPFAEIRTDNPQYRQIALAAFTQHQAAGHGSSADADKFFLAQVLWDETMAESIARYARTNPDTQIIVLAGQGHVISGYGIPSRVKRRVNNIIQRSVLFSQADNLWRYSLDTADFIWVNAAKD